MNAAFLLVTTVWLAGAEAPPPPPKAPAPPAACTADCGACCDTCCHRERLLDRLRGLFNRRDCCDSCCPPCPKPCPPPCPKPCPPPKCCVVKTCCEPCCERERLLDRIRNWLASRRHKDCCDPCCAPACPTTCCVSKCKPSCCPTGGCGTCCETCCREGLLARIRNWLSSRRHKDCCDACCAPSCGGAPGKPEAIPAPKEKMPSGEPMKPVSVIEPVPEMPKTTLSVETETKNPFELHRRYESRVAHAPDYSYLTGQLFYVHADGGLWILRYAPLWQEDANGGSIVLARDLRMSNYHEGDLVTVHGEIINQKSSIFLGGPLYRAQSIQMVESGSN